MLYFSFDKKSMMTRIKTSQMYMEKIPKLEREYNNVISSNFRTLEVKHRKIGFKNCLKMKCFI